VLLLDRRKGAVEVHHDGGGLGGVEAEVIGHVEQMFA
jgi:hypothetical protein